MKLQYYLFAICLTLIFSSCEKKVEVAEPDFNVSASTLTVKAGVPVNFSFQGKAGLISFYSGEAGKEFQYRSGRTFDAGLLKLSFTSGVQLGTQANQLSVLASSDFNGNYSDYASISTATWINITSRFALGTTTTFLASGVKDISDVRTPGKPLYIAYKYLNRPQAANGSARTWMIQGFSLTGESPMGALVIADMNNSGFRIFDQNATTAPGQSAVTAARITLWGNVYDAANDPQGENWAISKAINVDQIDPGPDKPVAIKGNSDSAINSYSYTYTKAGVYKASFVAANINAYESSEVVRQFEITVTP